MNIIPEMNPTPWIIYLCFYSNLSLTDFLFSGDCESAVHHSYLYTLSIIDRFRQEVRESGWLTDPVLLGPEEWRATWNIDGLSDKKYY